MSAHLDLAARAAEALQAAGYRPQSMALSPQAQALAWEEQWSPSDSSRVALTACFQDGLRSGQSVHLSLNAVTLELRPELAGSEGWIRFAAVLAAHLLPLQLGIDDTTGRVYLSFEQVLHPSARLTLPDLAGELAYMGHFIVPAVRDFEPHWGGDEGQELADMVRNRILSRGLLS